MGKTRPIQGGRGRKKVTSHESTSVVAAGADSDSGIIVAVRFRIYLMMTCFIFTLVSRVMLSIYDRSGVVIGSIHVFSELIHLSLLVRHRRIN